MASPRGKRRRQGVGLAEADTAGPKGAGKSGAMRCARTPPAKGSRQLREGEGEGEGEGKEGEREREEGGGGAAHLNQRRRLPCDSRPVRATPARPRLKSGGAQLKSGGGGGCACPATAPSARPRSPRLPPHPRPTPALSARLCSLLFGRRKESSDHQKGCMVHGTRQLETGGSLLHGLQNWQQKVEVRSGSEGYVIKMRDGKKLRCVHNNCQGRNIPESAPQPAIVLKIEDGSETLLPIIVLEMPSVLLMAAIRNVHIARPTIYQVVKEMIDKMGYDVKLVRINKRIHEAYCAELYLTKIGDHTESITFDLRPSDAINIAVRCKVPIQVHRSLAYSDGIRSVEPARMVVAAGVSDGLLFTELDRPDGQPCVEAEEFGLVRNMLIAAVEERYKDAATWRDKLMQLRSKRKNWA